MKRFVEDIRFVRTLSLDDWTRAGRRYFESVADRVTDGTWPVSEFLFWFLAGGASFWILKIFTDWLGL